MAKLRIGTFGTLTGTVVGGVVALGPSIGHAQEVDTLSGGSRFVASQNAMTPNALSPNLLRVQTQQQTRILSGYSELRSGRATPPGRRQSTSRDAFGEGLAAGNGADIGSAIKDKLGLWAGVDYTSSEDDFAATAYDSKATNVSVGADYQVFDGLVVGAFGSRTHADTDSAFNSGGSKSDTWSVGPYVIYTINQLLSADASAGFTFQDASNRRTIPAGTVTGNQDSDGWFGSVSLTATQWWSPWGLSGRIGVTYAEVDNETYRDSTGTLVAGTNTKLGQFQAGAQVSYFFAALLGQGLDAVLNVKLEYRNDFDRDDVLTAPGTVQPANDADEWVAGVGVALFAEGPLSGGINYSRTLAREDFDSWSIGGRVAYRF